MRVRQRELRRHAGPAPSARIRADELLLVWVCVRRSVSEGRSGCLIGFYTQRIGTWCGHSERWLAQAKLTGNHGLRRSR